MKDEAARQGRPDTSSITTANLAAAAAGGRRPFDLLEHHRRRTRRAEGRANGLELQLAKALRLLALAAQVAAGDECEPIVLLRALERVDEIGQRPGASIDDLAALVRATVPLRVTA